MNDSDRNDIVAYRINKAKETLIEINIIISNELWETAINRLYYASYYAVISFIDLKEKFQKTHPYLK